MHKTHGCNCRVDSNFFHSVSNRCFPLPSRVASPTSSPSYFSLSSRERADEAAARCDVLHSSIEPILEKKRLPPSPPLSRPLKEKHALSTRFMRACVSPMQLPFFFLFFVFFSFPSHSFSLFLSLSFVFPAYPRNSVSPAIGGSR